jgi:CPA2 family monovalent cation:H+ antiporter-2
VVAIIVVGQVARRGRARRRPGLSLRAALLVSASLAQIGEFSFILAALGLTLGLVTPEARSLIVGGALISIALNPLFFRLASGVEARLASGRLRWLARLGSMDDPLTELPVETDERWLSRQVVIVGYGRVGSASGRRLPPPASLSSSLRKTASSSIGCARPEPRRSSATPPTRRR